MRANEHRMRFPPTLAALADAAEDLRGWLAAEQVNGRSRYNVELAFEEVVANIVRHGAPTDDVEVAIRFDADEIVMTFEDDGIPFDPRGTSDPVMPASIEEAEVGGLGLVLLRTILSRIAYQRTPQQRNLLTLAIQAR